MKTDFAKTLTERAIEAAHDYAIMLRERYPVAPPPPEAPVALTQLSQEALLAADVWMGAKEIEWVATGRISRFGTLKVDPDEKPEPWTLRKIKRCFPELRFNDRLAVLIELDGVLMEEDMGAVENVVAVMEKMVDRRIMQIFGEALQRMGKDRSSLWGGRLPGDAGVRKPRGWKERVKIQEPESPEDPAVGS